MGQWRNLYFTFQSLSAKDPIYLSEHIFGGMSELYWQRWGELGDECAHIVRSAHILLIQFWEIGLPQKKKKKSCHYFVTQRPRWQLQQITSVAGKKGPKKKQVIGL